jgi:hypothetical protein
MYGIFQVVCEAILLTNVNVNASNVIRYFEVAEKYKCMKLHKKTLNYICTNYSELSQNNDFNALLLTHPKLSLEISRFLIESKLNDYDKDSTAKFLVLLFLVFVCMYLLSFLFK